MAKALFTVGVFGIPAKLVDGVVRVKVNERTDQARQWEAAKIPAIPGVSIVDCPGGAVHPGEKLADALAREIAEETGGCSIEVLDDFSKPFDVISEGTAEKPGDLAFWVPVKLIGEPKLSNEALSHPWISMAEFEAEVPYRCVSGLGNKGRTGRMMCAALQWFEENRDRPEIFS